MHREALERAKGPDTEENPLWDAPLRSPSTGRQVEDSEALGDRPRDGPPSSTDIRTGLEERGLIGRFNESATVRSPITPVTPS